jgi:hypothetical protein
LAVSVIFVFGLRQVFIRFLNNPEYTTPTVLTSDFIDQLECLNLFTPEFLLTLNHGATNPFTTTFMLQLKAEFDLGDQILFDTGIHSILGDLPPNFQEVLTELVLISPIL